jgi:3-methyladenine DNA glycosylase AlkD
MLLNYYIDEAYLDRVLQSLDQIRLEAYYAQMAVAWALSICYIRFPARTLNYLQGCGLDDFTYRKTLQKIIESHRVDLQEKEVIRQLRHGRISSMR